MTYISVSFCFCFPPERTHEDSVTQKVGQVTLTVEQKFCFVSVVVQPLLTLDQVYEVHRSGDTLSVYSGFVL